MLDSKTEQINFFSLLRRFFFFFVLGKPATEKKITIKIKEKTEQKKMKRTRMKRSKMKKKKESLKINIYKSVYATTGKLMN